VGDGTNFVAESGATARESLGIYTGSDTHLGGNADTVLLVDPSQTLTGSTKIILTITSDSGTVFLYLGQVHTTGVNANKFEVKNSDFSPSITFNYLIIN
jgi:hypothetical protein